MEPSSTRTEQVTMRLSQKTKRDLDDLCKAMGVKTGNYMAQVISERVMKEKQALDIALKGMEQYQDKMAEKMGEAFERIMTNPAQLQMLMEVTDKTEQELKDNLKK